MLQVMATTLIVFSCCACAQGPKLPVVYGYFVNESGSKTPRFTLEVCSTDAQRSLGLMYRKELPALGGMVFVFGEQKEHSFWMKNTYLTLDMVFVDKNMRVVGILSDVPPLNEEPRTVGVPSMYVLEFLGGTMRAHGVESGARLEIQGSLPAGQ